jgi:homoserine kinase
LPLAGKHGVLGVALSGAGPAVLLVIEKEECLETALLAVRAEIGDAEAELLTCAFEPVGASEALIHVKGR